MKDLGVFLFFVFGGPLVIIYALMKMAGDTDVHLGKK